MKVISVINRRGGAGKTVTAHAIGAGLSNKGYKILFVDMDSQANLTFDLGVINSEHSALDLFKKKINIDDLIIKLDKYDLIPSNQTLSIFEKYNEELKEFKLAESLKQVKKNYDFVIIDTPPALSDCTVNALTASDYAIITANAEIHSIQGLFLIDEIIKITKKIANKKIKVLGVLVTRYNGRAVLSKDMLLNIKNMSKELGYKTFNTTIRECIAIKEAQAKQKDIFSYSKNSNAAKDYASFLEELMPAIQN